MDLISKSRNWLAQDVFPLWSKQGIDPRTGAFVECLSRDGQAMDNPRRAMVQARQIYSFAEAARMGILAKSDVQGIVRKAVDVLIANYSLENGAFVHSADTNGKPVAAHTDLYTQAFALFGMAEAYGMLGDSKIKQRAEKLMSYLRRVRRIEDGGYSELIDGKVAFEANPHMHMFEAAIAWMKVDKDSLWREFAAEIEQLCRTKFVDPASGALCEHFEKGWKPQRESEGFVWEPGHHFEWAWLLVQYAEVAGQNAGELPFQLFKVADKMGVKNKIALDEVWSSGKIKKASARFWPQSERVKAAVALGALAPKAEQKQFAQAADDGLEQLFKYFENIRPGLWEDTRSESGSMVNQPAKASSLYHIINAMSEYARLRPKLA